MADIEKLQAHFRAVDRLRGFEVAGLSTLFEKHPSLQKDVEEGVLDIRWSRRHFVTLKKGLVEEGGTTAIVVERLSAGDVDLMVVPISRAKDGH